MIEITHRSLYDNQRGPLLIKPTRSQQNIAAMATQYRPLLQQWLLEHGALLFRGFRVAEVQEFELFMRAATRSCMEYVYGSSPRTRVGDRIYTATEYPATQEIPLHSENAYQLQWPLKIAFCCLQPAASGGETPLADLRRVTAAIGSRLLDELERRRVLYIRHYRRQVDLPWQTVFRTEDRAQVARYCREQAIEHEWLEGELLRTRQVCQGVAYHPITRERLFFNQAHLFHVSSLGDSAARSMMEVFGADRLPRQSHYGDGADFSTQDLLTIRSAFAAARYSFPWCAGDILLLDNMQFAHGRQPFKGYRRVLAALAEPCAADGPIVES